MEEQRVKEFKDKKRPTKRKNNSSPHPKDGNQFIIGGGAFHRETSHTVTEKDGRGKTENCGIHGQKERN